MGRPISLTVGDLVFAAGRSHGGVVPAARTGRVGIAGVEGPAVADVGERRLGSWAPRPGLSCTITRIAFGQPERSRVPVSSATDAVGLHWRSMS